MLSLDEAVERLLGQVRPPAPERAETVSTFDALGRVLAEDVRSLLDVPPADNSAMDGYALRAADVADARHGAAASASGSPPAASARPLEPGTAARIFTGAQVPAGADAVVMQEHCTPVDGGVRIDASPTPGQSIRRRGEDVQRGATVLRAGMRLGAAGARHGRLGRRGDAQGRRAAARRAVLHRRRAGDARRRAQARGDLQLEPLHPARPDPGAGRRLRTTSASSPTGSTPPARRCAAPPAATT